MAAIRSTEPLHHAELQRLRACKHLSLNEHVATHEPPESLLQLALVVRYRASTDVVCHEFLYIRAETRTVPFIISHFISTAGHDDVTTRMCRATVRMQAWQQR